MKVSRDDGTLGQEPPNPYLPNGAYPFGLRRTAPHGARLVRVHTVRELTSHMSAISDDSQSVTQRFAMLAADDFGAAATRVWRALALEVI